MLPDPRIHFMYILTADTEVIDTENHTGVKMVESRSYLRATQQH
jgi:hypothetical protein